MLYQLEGVYKDAEGYHDTIKIGYSFENFEGSRKQAYDTHNPGYKLLGEIKGTREDEGWLHWLFRDDLIKGEWFKDSPEIRFVFQEYKPDLRPTIKSFYNLSRGCQIVEAWAQILKADRKEWTGFLWDLSCRLASLGTFGEVKQNPYVIWNGPGSHDYMPTRDILRKALEEIRNQYSEKILEWVEETETIKYPGIFDPMFFLEVYNDYPKPIYPGLLKEYCMFLDKNPGRDDIKKQFYDPRYKMAYEKLGTKGCEKLEYNLGKICSLL